MRLVRFRFLVTFVVPLRRLSLPQPAARPVLRTARPTFTGSTARSTSAMRHVLSRGELRPPASVPRPPTGAWPARPPSSRGATAVVSRLAGCTTQQLQIRRLFLFVKISAIQQIVPTVTI